MRSTLRLLTAAASSLLVLLTSVVRADDTEIFNVASTSSSAPNILFILDTSGSMGSTVYKVEPYDSTINYDATYTNACNKDNIYYAKGTTVPTCKSSPSFTQSTLKCDAATKTLFAAGGAGNYHTNGIRWVATTTTTTSTSTPKTARVKQTVTRAYTATGITTQNTTTNTTTTVYVPVSKTTVVTVTNNSGSIVFSGPTTTVTPVPPATAPAKANLVSSSVTPTTSTTTSNGPESVVTTGSPSTTTTTGSTVTNPTPPASTIYGWSTELNLANTSNTVTTSNVATPVPGTTPGSPTAGTASPSSVTSAPVVITDTPTIGSFTSAPTSATQSNTPIAGRKTKTDTSYTYTATTTVTHSTVTKTTTTLTPYTRKDTDFVDTTTTATKVITAITYSNTDIECDGDKTTGSGSSGYPNNVSPTAGTEWTNTKANSYWDNGGALQDYNFYSGNYLNYLKNPPSTAQGTRMQVMKDAMDNLLDSMTGVNVGLMRYDTNAHGGMVAHEVAPITTAKDDIKTALASYSAGGNTPLSETMYEAYLYYSGLGVNFGDSSSPFKSVAAARTGNSISSSTYQSPITSSCFKNYIVYLTDGLPTADTEADASIKALNNFNTLAGPDKCVATTYGASNGGDCLGALSQYMYHADLNGSLTGDQGVASYFVGFGSDFGTGGQLNTAFDYLKSAASRGGGLAYSATDAEELTTVLTKIVTDAIVRNTSFAAPTVAVNAFNRTQTLNDLYISMFQPTTTKHWPGNIKKYHVKNGAIVDQDNAAAVDPLTGFFAHSARSFWTKDPDGAGPLANGDADGENVVYGGAAHNIPAPSARTIYTYIASNLPASPVDLTSDPQYQVTTTNTLITGNPALLGDASLNSTDVNNLINWARGMDTDDVDNKNGSKTDSRSVMGDPVHARPAAVIYGGTEADPDTVIFAPTNDGYLHAIGGKDTDGVELWAFIPQELLPEIKSLHDDSVTATKHYSLDGNVRVMKYDINGDGKIDPSVGDRVYIYFSQGRGGNRYYALDVTYKDKPKFMWSIGAAELPGVGQSWSTPAVSRVNIAGASQNSQKLVLIFGGGYDPNEDSAGYHAANAVGSHIYMVDAVTGSLLWSVGSGASIKTLARMDHSIPSDITVMDLDGDGYADRMYVGDMAAQLWRFDIFNGQSVTNLVTGGVIASLGTHDDTTHAAADNRRFYSPPDVAGVQPPTGGPPYFNIAIGSGYRGHPLNTAAEDRFYAVRDKQPFDKFNQTYYDSLAVLHDADMTDITNNLTPTLDPVTTNGWQLKLNYPSWQGEKVLAPSTTFQNNILFTTYIPSINTATTATGCGQSSVGINRAYLVSVFDGSPVKKHNEAIVSDGSSSSSSSGSSGSGFNIGDRFDDLAQGGIAPEAAFLFPGGNQIVCLSGAEVLGACRDLKGFLKTYWRESGAQ